MRRILRKIQISFEDNEFLTGLTHESLRKTYEYKLTKMLHRKNDL